jgi:hypothetical protein
MTAAGFGLLRGWSLLLGSLVASLEWVGGGSLPWGLDEVSSLAYRDVFPEQEEFVDSVEVILRFGRIRRDGCESRSWVLRKECWDWT